MFWSEVSIVLSPLFTGLSSSPFGSSFGTLCAIPHHGLWILSEQCTAVSASRIIFSISILKRCCLGAVFQYCLVYTILFWAQLYLYLWTEHLQGGRLVEFISNKWGKSFSPINWRDPAMFESSDLVVQVARDKLGASKLGFLFRLWSFSSPC